ncbi:hypothetical protein ACLM45_04030 [Synechococcus sp. A10-1-5-9]|uniref:hypothetical protein n=1 Tax=Synechococcus sp. A10-1-5-9 TaxID=3392295 RepID=UPI0039E94D65
MCSKIAQKIYRDVIGNQNVQYRNGGTAEMPLYKKSLPDKEILLSNLNYDKDTGIFTWKKKSSRKGRANDGNVAAHFEVASSMKNGYRKKVFSFVPCFASSLYWVALQRLD